MMTMTRKVTQVILGTAILALTPFLPAVSDGGVEAGVRASVQIGVSTPVAVFGISYNDPYVFGHVHATPLACTHGPLYYYPAYGVYGHYVPRYRYVRYEAPRYYLNGMPYVRPVHPVRGFATARRPYIYTPRPIVHRHDGHHGKGHRKGHHVKGHDVR